MTDKTKLGFAARCGRELWLALELCVGWVQSGETCIVCGRFWSKYLCMYVCMYVLLDVSYSLQLDKWDCQAVTSNSGPIITFETSVLWCALSLDCFPPLRPDFSARTNHVEFQRDKENRHRFSSQSSGLPPNLLTYWSTTDAVIVLATDSVAISGFSREVPENCAVLCHYTAISGNFLPMFRDNLSVPSSGLFSLEYRTDKLSQNVRKKLPLIAV